MRSRVSLLFAGIALLLMLSLGAIYWIGVRALGKEKEASARRNAIDQLNIVLSTLKDAETGQRGFLLTARPAYLAPFALAQDQIGTALAKLTTELDLQERASPDFSQLIDLVPQKLAELKETVDLIRAGKQEEALSIVRSDRGKNLMDEIRASVSKIQSREQDAIAGIQRSFDESILQRDVGCSLIIIVNLAFVFWAHRRIHQEMRARIAAMTDAQRQKELLRVTLLSIGDAVIVADAEGKITEMNKVAEELTGWAPSESAGKPCETVFKIINEESRQSVESPVTKVLREGVIAGLANHTLLIARNGREIPIDDSGAPIRDVDGSLRGVVLIFRDFSSHKATEKQLKRAADELLLANKTKDYFLATLSHELRTPMGAILGWSSLMKESPDDRNIRSQGLDVIERNAIALSKLLSDLLDISRIASGSLALEFQEIDLNQIVSQSIQTFVIEATRKKIRLLSVLANDKELPVTIRGDPIRLQEIVTNILGNALKFTPEEGTVTVSLGKFEKDAIIEVKDTGIGFSPEIIGRIFEPFFQAEPGSSRSGGMGLGLAISKRLVELHGGAIMADSGGPGLGATFRVQFPLSAFGESATGEIIPEVLPNQIEDTRHARLTGLTIMAVDDHADTRDLLKFVLERSGARTSVLGSAKEALAAIKMVRPDVLLCDLSMPEMDGYELVEKVQTLEPVIGMVPVIACTALAQSEEIARTRRAGFKAHLAKPLDAEELVATILKVVEPQRKPADSGFFG